MKKTFVLMRFYGGGGLARFEIVTASEECLIDPLQKFEEDCVRSNEGEYCGVLEKEEFNKIAKQLQ